MQHRGKKNPAKAITDKPGRKRSGRQAGAEARAWFYAVSTLLAALATAANALGLVS